jgi:Ca2+-binding EF-hand superfamily protein
MTIKNIRWIALSTLAALSISTLPALAEEGAAPRDEHRFERLVQKFDKNGDGKLQVTELPEGMQKHLGTADTNKDGIISEEEFAAAKANMRKEHFEKMDTNKDGQISPEERAAAREAREKEHFTKMDKNGDGQVSAAEVPPGLWAKLKVADTDNNGAVSFDEMTKAITAGTLKMGPHGHGHHHESPPEANE